MANRLINKTHLRKFILAYAGRARSHSFTQVADSVYDDLEATLRKAARQLVDTQPSKGRTIK